MDEGPTTAGSIIAKLKMDFDQWVVDKARVKEDAREIGALSPNVHIDSNVPQVLAQTEALNAALLEEAAAQGVAEKSTVKANEANRTSVTRMGMIVTAVAVLVPMLVPLAAFAVGAAGALTMMGVAGVLAVVGIKRAMAEGTAAGQQYSAGMQLLKGDMQQLSETAAVRMLDSYLGAVGQINASMPTLNRQVGIFSEMLGQSGSNLLTGALNGIRVLEPLLITVGQYVDGLTLKFARWTGNAGLQQFGSYAMSVLPTVEAFLGSLGTAVMHLLQALSALGLAGMSVFGALFQLIAATPVQVLADLIAAVTWGTLAFKAWGFVAPLLETIALRMGAVGLATTAATGPIGWIVAGIGALVAVLAVSVTAANSAARAVDTYAAAVQADNGIIAENVRLQAAKNLQDAGAIANATRLGIATDKVVTAALGNKAVAQDLNYEIYKQSGYVSGLSAAQQGWIVSSGNTTAKQREQLKAGRELSTQLDTETGGIKAAIKVYNQLQNAIGGSTIATEAQLRAEKANADAAGVSISAYVQATGAQRDTARQTEQTTALMYLQGDAAGLLKQQLDLLNGKTISAAQAQNQFDSQLANMADHMDASGKQIDRANTLLEGNTAAAVKNRGELINLTVAAQTNAQAFRDNGGSAEDARQKLVDMKLAIIDNAVAHGEDRDQVQSYVDTLFKIPESIPATKIEVDTSEALAKVAALRAAIGEAGLAAGLGVSDSGVVTFSDARNTYQGHADGGTISGPGTSTSDSVLRRMSVGEEVIRESSARQARPFLKAFNSNPGAALASVAATGGQKTVHFEPHYTEVTGGREAVDDGLRRLAMVAA